MRRVIICLAGIAVLASGVTDPAAAARRSSLTNMGEARPSVASKLGPSFSGLPWLSGVWSGGRFSPSAIAAYGRWRGRRVDLVTTYSGRDSYRAIASETWSINVWKGVPGRLNYGLGILPNSREGSFASIARGDQDWVWRAVAKNLKSAGRGNSVVRIAWEANLPDWRWGATAANAPAFRAAFRRVSPELPNIRLHVVAGNDPECAVEDENTGGMTRLPGSGG